MMKVFVFNNLMGNYCSGDYYFVAMNRQEANIMAGAFSKYHNIEAKNNRNYTIEWDLDNVKECVIVPGYLPLNRVSLQKK